MVRVLPRMFDVKAKWKAPFLATATTAAATSSVDEPARVY